MEPSAGNGVADGNEGQSVLLSRIALNDNKAGMEGLDRDKINKIILETSKGSRFYENELKKEHQVNQRIEKMLRYKAKVTEQQIQKAQEEVEKLTAELERGRELGRVIVHVDMDAFYAAVEMRDCPELKEKPMAVGSMSMLSTSNYHARRYGVRAAMPGFIAKKLCPNLVIVPLNFDKYRAVSEQVREIFADYDPQFLPMSLDEAYLDITDHLEQRQHWPESMRTYHISGTKTEGDIDKTCIEVGAETDTLSPVLFEDSPSSSPTFPGVDGNVEVFGTSPEEAVREMRFRIEQKTSLTASAGIAPNMMLAKVCSDKNKPNGQYRIPNERQAVMDFIQDLPVRKVSGIGKVTEKMLAALDIISCAQLGQQMAILSLLFSETSWHHFLQISLGLGSTHIERDSERKSMSTERTFGEMSDSEEQYSLCRELCHDLAKDLQKEGLKGKTITLKLKNVNFEVKTKAFTLQCAICTEEEIFAAAKDLLKAEIDNVSPQPLRLRLMGVRISSFINTDNKRPQQKSIVGFLKIASDSSSSTQPPRVFFRPEEGSVSESSVSSLKQQSEIRSPSVVEEIPRLFIKLGDESEGTRRPQQQTFFQRALSRRLQQESEQETSLSSNRPFTATDSTVSHACSSRTCAEIDKTVVKTDTSLSATNTASHITEHLNMQTLVKAQSSDMPQCFTCPVCFNEMKTTDLRVFNQHIDECLKGSAVDNGSRFMDVGQDVCEEEKQLDKRDHVEKDQSASYHAKATASSSGTSTSLDNLNRSMLTVADEWHCTSNAVATKPVFEDGADSDFMTPFFKRFTNMNERRSLVPDEAISVTDSGSKALKQTFSPDAVRMKDANVKISTLTCPVCNQAQDTDDLTLFNRHVDMCLNQEMLLEFREAGLPCGQSVTVLLGKAKDHERASTTRGKSKRRGSSPNPPSKKSKAISTRHTIDKFFKGNSNQTF